jgi:hypothetical protein
MSLPIYLIRRHQHVAALSAAGLLPENPVFPAVINCPLCKQNALHLFDDAATESVWLYCNGCKSHGDIITFAASIWNILPDAAVDKFAEIGAIRPEDLANYRDDYAKAVETQTLAKNFWEQSAAQFWAHPDDTIACRLRELGVYKELPTVDLVGVAEPEQIEAFCVALGRRVPPVIRQDGASIVLPYHTFPGRLSGFLLTQYSDTLDRRVDFIPLTGRKRRPEAGYFLLQTALAPPTEVLKNTQFITQDPFWVLKQQCWQIKHGLPLLPLMSGYIGQEAANYGKSWTAFHPAQRVFQSDSPQPEVVSCACNAGGYVSVRNDLHVRRHRSNSSLEVLASIKKNAMTWRAALSAAIDHVSEPTAHSFLSKLCVPHEKLAVFLARYEEYFSPGFATRVLNASAAKTQVVRVTDKRAVLEKNNNWYTATGAPICNGRVVIEKIIYTNTDEKFYAGKIFFNDRVVDFIDSADGIETAGLLAYAAKKLAEFGELFIYDRRWNFKAHTCAVKLHPPKVVNVASTTGWDEGTSVFRLGSYEFDAHGNQQPTLILPNKHSHLCFPEPPAVMPHSLRMFLTPSYENSFVWNAFSALAANLIAPIVNRFPSGTATTAANFKAAASIWSAMGATGNALTYVTASNVSRYVKENTRDTNWPVYASSAFDDATFSYVVAHCHNRPILIQLTRPCAHVAPSYGWSTITGTPPSELTDFSVFQYVLPAYIQHVLKTRLNIGPGQDLTTIILRDVHQWLQNTQSATFNLLRSQCTLFTPATSHVALAAELNEAVQDGSLDVLPRPRRNDQPKNYLLRQKTAWWLNRRGIDSYFKLNRSVPPNWLEIVNLLAENGALVGEQTIQNMPGFLVTNTWCDNLIELRSQIQTKNIGG